MKKYMFLLLSLGIGTTIYAQQTLVSGVVIAAHTFEKISKSTIAIEKTNRTVQTTKEGSFQLECSVLPEGEYILTIAAEGYHSKKLPFVLQHNIHTDLGTIVLEQDHTMTHITTLQLADQELTDTAHNVMTVSGALHADRDVFLTAAAFDWSAAYVKPRGQESSYGKVWINGVDMNSLTHGKPEWNTWGGLNDVQRQQEFTTALAAQNYGFGDLGGQTQITMRASEYRRGVRISYALANKSYTGSVRGTLTSGLLPKGWAYAISISRRFGQEGYIQGTPYDANALFVGIEKRWKRHAISMIGMYTPNTRGRAAAITKEVYQLKGRTYNPYWGYQNGEVRNARIQRVRYPIGMLSHFWDLKASTQLQTHLSLQLGTAAQSRIDSGGKEILAVTDTHNIFIGGGNSTATNPMHPRALPSFYIQEEHPNALAFQKAFLAQEDFRAHGQLNWDALSLTNQQNAQLGHLATYALYEDTTENRILQGTVLFNSKLSTRFSMQGKLQYRNEDQKHYAKITDVLGGSGFLDIDQYAEADFTTEDQIAQSDLNHPNRQVTVGDRFKYHYDINATVAKVFLQTQYIGKHLEGTIGGYMAQTIYQRKGHFENGHFPGTASYGKSKISQSITSGIKGILTYKFNWRNTLNLIAAAYTKAPTIANTFVNPRQNNTLVADVIGGKQDNEEITTIEANYTRHTSKLRAKITGYYIQNKAATQLSFFFTQAIRANQSAFVQQILTDIDRTYLGAELGISYQITPTLTLKSAMALGQHSYSNAPNLFLTSTSTALQNDKGFLALGKSALQSYRLPTGPQQVIHLGVQYRDPKYWWFGLTANYFMQSYTAISPLARTTNFALDVDGLPFNNYELATAKKLLQQEMFDPYWLINATAGTSWRIGKTTIGLFVAVQNILHQEYRTGGFENARTANYQLALTESKRQTPIYGSRYYYGAGTTYYCNLYLKL